MATRDTKLRWTMAAAIAVGVLAALPLLFRLPERGAPERAGPRKGPEVQLAKPTAEDEVLKDEATIRDLRPLFLPTDFNVGLPEPRREPGRTILDQEKPLLTFTEMELGIGRNLPPVAVLNSKPADAAQPRDVLASPNPGVGLVGMGRKEGRIDAMVARGAFVEVVAVATGQLVLAESLSPQLAPVGGKPWEPMELFAAVDPAGLAAPLVVTESSRVDEVDQHFRKVLAQTYRIGERLAPGFYRIVLGP